MNTFDTKRELLDDALNVMEEVLKLLDEMQTGADSMAYNEIMRWIAEYDAFVYSEELASERDT